ncbi:MAG TPA: porin, partial [Cytophagales bacterium]|nr:porin [Cytophagales bacterium]
GLGICTSDSSFSLHLRFRMQNRFLMNTVSDENLNPASWEARVRRCRLSFAGHILDQRLTYYLQLSFSRGDMDWNAPDGSVINTSPNVVRDAVVYYRPFRQLQVGLGQTKLPGNRQRVISSGAQQFYDRSIVNALFTLDRDFGIFAHYSGTIVRDFRFGIKGAVSSGEGRNNIVNNSGLAYTARLELLPLGKFTDEGDYFEGDLVREGKPKISLGVVYHYNDLAMRSQGQLGRDLLSPKSYSAFIADFLLKYKGIALSSEYLRRDHDNPVSSSATSRSSLNVGSGLNSQLSYCFKNRYEMAMRHSITSLNIDNNLEARINQQIGLGVTKYLNKHKVKLQFNIFRDDVHDKIKQRRTAYYFAVFQVELGI